MCEVYERISVDPLDLFDLKLINSGTKFLRNVSFAIKKYLSRFFSVNNVFIFVSHHGKSERERELFGSTGKINPLFCFEIFGRKCSADLKVCLYEILLSLQNHFVCMQNILSFSIFHLNASKFVFK